MTFRGNARDAAFGGPTAAPGAVAITDEPETAVTGDEESEDTPRAAATVVYEALPARGEDPVRLYLKEIGRVPLLKAAQEVQIGRRIEVGQIALRSALTGIPMAVEALLEVGDGLRRGEVPADDLIVLPEGGELEAKAIRPVLLAFGRLRRLQNTIDPLPPTPAPREAIQKTVAGMPLKPALIDGLVARVRRHCERIEALAKDRQPAAARELRALERAAGLPRRRRAGRGAAREGSARGGPQGRG